METQCKWEVGGGDSLIFDILGVNTKWNSVPGVYIFGYRGSDAKWNPVYIGMTTDFSDRLPTHEIRDQAFQLGATHIHAKVMGDQANRAWYEKKLIELYQPPLNKQYR